MSFDPTLPEDIQDAVRFLKEAGQQKYLTRADKDNLNRAKLRIAFWSLRSEDVVASRENLSYLLGEDANEIMSAYDRYLERDEEESRDKTGRPDGKKRSGSGFWENV